MMMEALISRDIHFDFALQVQDIRSFFKSPSNSNDDASSGSPSNVRQVPNKRSRGRRPPPAAGSAGAGSSSSTSSSPATDQLDKRGKKASRPEDEDDSEDPIPKTTKMS